MELKREHWSKADIKEFQEYLKSFSKGKEKGEWEQRIVATAMPCLAVPSQKVHEISKQISKGNFLEFLDLWIWEYHTNTVIIGDLICCIKDFELQKKYLLKYSKQADNWATIDVLKLKFSKDNLQNYLAFAKEIVRSPHPFTRRLGLIILLKMTGKDGVISDILEVANSLYEEEHYYVNMANAWLIAECFTKHREETLRMFQNNNLNKFTVNKSISKCRDSFRISQEDKDYLIRFRKKD